MLVTNRSINIARKGIVCAQRAKYCEGVCVCALIYSFMYMEFVTDSKNWWLLSGLIIFFHLKKSTFTY